MSSFTQQQIDTLEAAIAEGVLEVQYADKKVTYRSLGEMMRTLDLMRKAVNPDAAKNQNNGRRYASYSKGL